ncbi:MAG TPA: efflux transporter outer membrane subunit [Planctomycetota bacterium]
MRPQLAFAFLLCTACAVPGVPPPAAAMPATPADWTAGSAAAGSGLESDWWSAFGDPQAAVIVAEALTANRDLQAAAARVRGAAAQARIAGAGRLPQLAATAAARRSRQAFFGFPIPALPGVPVQDPLTSTTEVFDLGLAASWEPDLWGRLAANERAAVAQAEAAALDEAAARLALAGRVLRGWYALGEAEAQLELAQRAHGNRVQTVERIRLAYEHGLQPPAAVSLAESQEAAAAAELEIRRQQADALSRSVEVLLGRYPAGALLQGGVLPENLGTVPAGLPAELVGRRPDLAAAERRLLAADAQLEEARASLYPRLSLTASGGTSSDTLSELLDGDFRVWSLLGNLTAPLFQGGRLRAGVDAGLAGADQARANFAQAALVAYEEVEGALSAADLLPRRVAALRRAALAAAAAESSARERFQSGIGDLLVLLEAQRGAWQAESLLLQARRLVLDARIDLYLALGGGFTDSRGGSLDASQ